MGLHFTNFTDCYKKTIRYREWRTSSIGLWLHTGRLNRRTVGTKELKTSASSIVSSYLLENLADIRVNGLAWMSALASMQFHCCLMSVSGVPTELLSPCSSHDSYPCFPLGHHNIFPFACIHFINVFKDFSMGKALSQVQEETHRHVSHGLCHGQIYRLHNCTTISR